MAAVITCDDRMAVTGSMQVYAINRDHLRSQSVDLSHQRSGDELAKEWRRPYVKALSDRLRGAITCGKVNWSIDWTTSSQNAEYTCIQRASIHTWTEPMRRLYIRASAATIQRWASIVTNHSSRSHASDSQKVQIVKPLPLVSTRTIQLTT